MFSKLAEMNTARRTAIFVLMAVVPIMSFAVWYLAWFDHADCLDALRQIGNPADPLYRDTQVQCLAAEDRRRFVEIYGLALALGTEVLLWTMLKRRKRT